MNNRNDHNPCSEIHQKEYSMTDMVHDMNSNFILLQEQIDELKKEIADLKRQNSPSLDLTTALKTPPKSILSSDLAASITEKIQEISGLKVNAKTIAAHIGTVRRLLLIPSDSNRVREYSLEDAELIESHMLGNWGAYAVESRASRVVR